MSYVVAHTVPVYVEIDDEGRVDRVVVDDENISPPEGWAPLEPNGWWNEDLRPPDPAKLAEINEAEDNQWPAWRYGW